MKSRECGSHIAEPEPHAQRTQATAADNAANRHKFSPPQSKPPFVQATSCRRETTWAMTEQPWNQCPFVRKGGLPNSNYRRTDRRCPAYQLRLSSFVATIDFSRRISVCRYQYSKSNASAGPSEPRLLRQLVHNTLHRGHASILLGQANLCKP
jgi:hypothetical protein